MLHLGFRTADAGNFSESQEGGIHEVMHVPVCTALCRCTYKYTSLALGMPGACRFIAHD